MIGSKIQLNPENIIKYGAILLIIISVVRLLKFIAVLDWSYYIVIESVIATFSVLLIMVIDPAIFSLAKLPLVCSFFILLSAIFNHFESGRASVLISFFGQLYTMYAFLNMDYKTSRMIARIVKYFAYTVSGFAVIMILLGQQMIQGMKAFSSADYGFRNLSGILFNPTYLGGFAFLAIIIIIFTEKINLKKIIIMIFLLAIIVMSSTRASVYGLMITLLLFIITKKDLRVEKKIFIGLIALIAGVVFYILWTGSVYNFKSDDTSRIMYYYYAWQIIRENIWFGTANAEKIINSLSAAQIHNFYLGTWMGFGIFVLLGYMVYLGWFFFRSGQRGRIMLLIVYLMTLVNPIIYVGFSASFFMYLCLVIYFNHYEKQLMLESEPVAESP